MVKKQCNIPTSISSQLFVRGGTSLPNFFISKFWKYRFKPENDELVYALFGKPLSVLIVPSSLCCSTKFIWILSMGQHGRLYPSGKLVEPDWKGKCWKKVSLSWAGTNFTVRLYIRTLVPCTFPHLFHILFVTVSLIIGARRASLIMGASRPPFSWQRCCLLYVA